MNKLPLSSLITLFLITGCAAPSLRYYNFSEGYTKHLGHTIVNYSETTPIILVQPVTVPDYLDTTDIITRNNTIINHSLNGRMSSVLSVATTSFITNTLSTLHPSILITNQHTVEQPTSQLVINITQFDVQETENKMGTATLKANWSIIPKNPHQLIQKQNGTFTNKGSITTDSDIISLEQDLLIQLINQINTNKLY